MAARKEIDQANQIYSDPIIQAYDRAARGTKKTAYVQADVNQISKHSNVIINVVLITVCILCLIPVWLIVVSSITDETSLMVNGYRFWPKQFSSEAYSLLFTKGSVVITSYKNTLLSTLWGTLFCMISVGLYAYPLSRSDFKGRNFFTFFSFFTMLFNGGMVAFYVTCRQVLGLTNSIEALYLPMSFSAYWVIVMRTFYKTNVPESILESARIDGAGEWRTFLQIVLPLSKPGLATVALFAAVGLWNNFFNCMLLNDDSKFYNLQYTIYKMLSNIRFLKENASQMGGSAAAAAANLPAETFRMAMAVVTVGPIVLAYPFFQRYFVKGLTIGAVKG